MTERAAPQRVLSVIESLGRGGAERLLVTTSQELDPTLFTHTVVSLFRPNPLASELRGLGVAVECYELPGPEALPKAIRLLRKTVTTFRPQVIHTHLFAANVAGRMAAFGKAAVVTTLHNPDYSQDPGEGWRFFTRSFLDRLSGHLVPSRLLAVSEHVRDDFRTTMGFEGIDVLPNATNVAALQSRASRVDRREARRNLGWDENDFVVLHIGRLHPQKGQDILIRALSHLAQRVSTAKLVLVGEGSSRSVLEAHAGRLNLADRVSFLGAVDDVIPLLVAADVFAFPSRFEAFGIALLECMAVGLPSVVSRIPGIDELADATTSIFVPPEDAGALGAALVRLQRNEALARQLGEGGRARALAFDIKPAVRRLEAIYESVANGGATLRA